MGCLSGRLSISAIRRRGRFVDRCQFGGRCVPGNAGWPIRCIEEMNSPCSAPFRRSPPSSAVAGHKGTRRPPGAGPGVHATRRAGDDRQHGHRWVQARLHEAQFVLDINADRFGAPEILVLPSPAALAWQRASASVSLSTKPKRNVQSCARRRPPSLKARAARPNGTRQRIRRSRGSAVRESPCSVTARTTRRAPRPRRALTRPPREPIKAAPPLRGAAPSRLLVPPPMRATLATASGAGRSARPRAGRRCPCPPSRRFPRAGARAQKKAPGCPGTKPWR